MTRIHIIILFTLLHLATSASVKLDPPGRHLVERYRSTQPCRSASERQIYLPSIIKLKDGESVGELEAEGIKIMRQRDNLLLAFIPTDHIDQLLTFSGVERVSIGQPLQPNLDISRPFGNVDDVINPSELWPDAWDGKGVVTGLCDIGFDPWHPNFIDRHGNPRVKRIVDYRDTLATVTRLYNPDEIAGWITDNDNEYHATHVAGIMAGGYRGNGYNGIASGSDIVAATSMLTDACILDGAEEIIDYARSVGKPAVINMSIGSYTGPHDGTTLFNQYLSKLGKEAIICIAAGNEGARPNNLQLDFTSDKSESSVFIRDCYGGWDDVNIFGAADFWSVDDTPFSMRISLYDIKTKKTVYTSPWFGADGQSEWSISTSDDSDGQSEHDPAFDNAYDGYFRASAEIDSENGRYTIYTSFDVTNHETVERVGRYSLVITVKGSPGTHVDGYADGYRCRFGTNGSTSFATPNSLMSISDIACGDNIIVVGASCARNTIPLIDGSTREFGYTVNQAAAFTGYGTLPDGRTLPHIAAPGCCVISSYSTPYLEKNPSQIKSMTAKATVNGRDVYWGFEGGTSMATPYVAGIIALWLQADPSLTAGDALDIAASTAMTGYTDIKDLRWGAGQIDALAGIKKVLSLSGVNDVKTDSSSPIVTYRDGLINVVCPGVDNIGVEIFTVEGRYAASAHGSGDTLSVDASTLAKGVYICRVNAGQRAVHSDKIIIR